MAGLEKYRFSTAWREDSEQMIPGTNRLESKKNERVERDRRHGANLAPLSRRQMALNEQQSEGTNRVQRKLLLIPRMHPAYCRGGIWYLISVP